MLKALGIILMVLAAVGALLSFDRGVSAVAVTSAALSTFIGGAVLLGLGSIQEDVRAIREGLAPAPEASHDRPTSTAASPPPTPAERKECSHCRHMNPAEAEFCAFCGKPPQVITA
jgi:hypothetical protein